MAKELHPLDVRKAGNDRLDPRKRVRVRDLGPRPDGSVRRADEIDRIESPPRAPARRDSRAASATGPWGAAAETVATPTRRNRRSDNAMPREDASARSRSTSAGRMLVRLVWRILLVIAIYLLLSRLLGGTGGTMTGF